MQNWDEEKDTLLAKAKEDEAAIQQLALMQEPLIEIIGFHAQQAVEKRLKALLAYRRTNYPYSHDLEKLIDLLERSGLEVPETVADAAILTQYAVQFRYTGYRGTVDSAKELPRMMAHVEAVRNWTDSLMR